MRIGMIQSNYIPWRGYFDFIDDCDLFVFYDDVQYTHKDWRNRNRIKTNTGPIWLSVPVAHDRHALIQDATIAYDTRWVAKHTRSIALAYQKSPHYTKLAGDFFAILNSRPSTISELNVLACRWIMARLGINTKTMMSCELGVEGDRHTRPLRILKELGATTYLTGPTALAYTDLSAFHQAGIGLEVKTYDYVEYPQLHGPFIGSVTVLDLLFNIGIGDQAYPYLKSTTPNRLII